MNRQIAGVTGLALACGLTLSTAANSATYQIEGQASIGKTTFKADNGSEFEVDNMGFRGTYYLMPVDSPSGPLRERPFIDKSAYIQLEYETAEPERGDETKQTSINAQFVTTTDLIFLLGYSSEDDGGSEDTTIMSIGIGKYLDARTTAGVALSQFDNGFSELNQVLANYRKLLNGNAAGTYIAYEGTLGYIDGEEDNGNYVAGEATYYPSEILGVSLGVDRIDIGDFDETGIELSGEYFLAPNLFGKLSYEMESDSNDVDTSRYAITIGGRF